MTTRNQAAPTPRRNAAPRWRTLALALLAPLALAACGDDGPSGPGILEATVTPPEGLALGAAALQISGEGIQGIREAGDTRLFVSSVGATDYRVVLVDPTPGELAFDVEVDDVGAAPPSATLTSAADGDNQPVMQLGEVRVRFQN